MNYREEVLFSWYTTDCCSKCGQERNLMKSFHYFLFSLKTSDQCVNPKAQNALKVDVFQSQQQQS